MVQCLELQSLLYDSAHDPSVGKDTLARLALAWERLEERKRILKGKPLPGNLRPVEPKRKGRKTGISITGHVLELPERVQEPPAEPPSAAVG